MSVEWGDSGRNKKEKPWAPGLRGRGAEGPLKVETQLGRVQLQDRRTTLFQSATTIICFEMAPRSSTNPFSLSRCPLFYSMGDRMPLVYAIGRAGDCGTAPMLIHLNVPAKNYRNRYYRNV